MNQYSNYLELHEQIETLGIVIVFLLGLLLLVIIRNWYNLYKKRSFRKLNKKLREEKEASQLIIRNNNEQLKATKNLETKLAKTHSEVMELEQQIVKNNQRYNSTLREKEAEITKQKEAIDYQKKAYERYVNFKNVETNNTRLGAHFIKNVISQIYEDIENVEINNKSFLGIQYNKGESFKIVPPLHALKNIFKLLDYNVSAINKHITSLEDELDHVHMYLELINYLKPNAKIELNNSLNKEQNNSIKIKPTLLFPFVENALKHGSLNENNSFISIELKKNDKNQLNYCLVNSAEQTLGTTLNKSANSNFGLYALRQLIDAYYPGSKIEHTSLPNRQYMSQLTLTLK